MQLKRDTDYALRILSCIGSRSAEGTMPPEGISLRTISSQTINGSENVSFNANAGVYTLQLIQGENVKTQKIVVE